MEGFQPLRTWICFLKMRMEQGPTNIDSQMVVGLMVMNPMVKKVKHHLLTKISRKSAELCPQKEIYECQLPKLFNFQGKINCC